MPATDQHLCHRLKLVLALLISTGCGQLAWADSEQQAEAKPSAAPTGLTGQQVYNQVCIACHYPPGLGGAPALGDSAAWASRIERGGVDELIDHALNGYSGSFGIMPRKGGRPDLSDAEIIAAVEFMLERAAP